MADSYPITLDLEGIKEILPHRKPALYICRGEILGPTKARGWAIFPDDWPMFEGHFPNHPVVPGKDLVECIGQTASLVLKIIPECQGLIGVFTGFEKIKFRGSVHPNEEISIESEITAHKKLGNSVYGTVVGFVKVGEQTIAQGKISFAAVPPEKMDKV